MKLKTLKDLAHYSGKYIHKEDLKQEAIKWIKFYREYNTEIEGGIAWYETEIRNQSKAFALINFFDITEEDLK